MKKNNRKNRQIFYAAIIAASVILGFSFIEKERIEEQQFTQSENENLRRDAIAIRADYEDMEEAYTALQEEYEREAEDVQSDIFGKEEEDIDMYLKVTDDTGTAKKKLKKGWQNRISKGVSQLLSASNLEKASKVALTGGIKCSVNGAVAYAASLDDDEESQIVIVYYSSYDKYLYFYQHFPKVDTENRQETDSGIIGYSNQGEDSVTTQSKAPVATVQTTYEQQMNREDTEAISEEKGGSIRFVSQEILAYIDQQELELQLEQFLAKSGYQREFTCFVQENFEVDNRNGYVIFTLILDGMDETITGVYDRTTGNYRFDF